MGTENDQATGQGEAHRPRRTVFNNKRPSMFDWTARRGVVERVTANKANVVVLWDGRKSMDVVPIRSVELEPELGLPQTEHRL